MRFLFSDKTEWGLFVAGKGLEAVRCVLFAHGNIAVVENAELPFDAGVVAGEAVEMRKDGEIGALVDGKESEGGDLKFVEVQHADVLESHPIHEQALEGGFRCVEAIEGAADFAVRRSEVGIKVGNEDFVSGGEAVLQSVLLHLSFSGESFGAGLTPIPDPFPTEWRKGVKGRFVAVGGRGRDGGCFHKGEGGRNKGDGRGGRASAEPKIYTNVQNFGIKVKININKIHK